MKDLDQPLLYSCSGCSSAAQMANDIALHIDRGGHAEMSCAAGLGGDIPALVRKAQSGRPLIALDGCPLHCVKATLARHGLKAKLHITLSDYGVKKHLHVDFDREEATRVEGHVMSRLSQLKAAMAKVQAASGG
ncbi:MAG: zinc-binding protein [Armatimonadetes bacterium]|nr:zinc-binding protein [Armatimonadota bacterium]